MLDQRGLWFFLIVAAIFGAALLLFYSATPGRRARRAAWRVPSRRIRDLRAYETARVIGTVEVEAERTVRSPLSGRECVYWHVVVQELGERGVWHTVLDEGDGVDFLVRDETGTVLVQPGRARAFLERDQRYYELGLLLAPCPELERFLASRGHASRDRSLRCYEGVLEPGEEAAVVGVGARRRNPPSGEATGYRDAPAPERLALTGPAGDALVLSNEPELMKP